MSLPFSFIFLNSTNNYVVLVKKSNNKIKNVPSLLLSPQKLQIPESKISKATSRQLSGQPIVF